MRIARSTGAMSGVAVVLLGIWGAIIPFVGPYFDYSFGSNETWLYSANRLWLCILPGVVAIIGGLLMLRANDRISGLGGAWLALMAGAWFVLGPAFSRLWEHAGAGPIGAPLFGDVRQMAELVGYFYGLGALIVGLSSVAIGRFLTRPALAGAPASRMAPIPGEASTSTTEMGTSTPEAEAPRGAGRGEGRQRRLFTPRRREAARR